MLVFLSSEVRKVKKPQVYWTKILCVLTVLPLLTSVAEGEVSLDTPACKTLSEQGPENQVSMFVAPVIDRPGIVCVRLYNGMPGLITYGARSLRLERRWFWLVWMPFLELEDVFGIFRVRFVTMQELVVRQREGKTLLLPSTYKPVPAGWYRVSFRYRVHPNGDQQIVYSEEFSLPP